MRRAEITARKNARKRNGNILIFLLLVAVAVAVMALLAALGGGDAGGEVTITVPEGASTADIADMLLEEKVIDDGKEFLSRAKEAGIDELLQSGVYVFTRGEPLEDILNKLREGLRDPRAVLTVPEGFSIYDIADLLAQKKGIAREEYLSAIGVDGRELPLGGSQGALDLEGFLFPSTYDLEADFDVDRLVDRQLETFRLETADIDWSRAAGLGVTEYEALIIASMVEREARVPEERPLIAAVIYNRIKEGMKLEIDATVQYALGYWKEDLTVDDLAVDSRFNTRLYPGLPPGPICNPGIESIQAALSPADVDYLYYVATGDDEGHHVFTSSYEEFLAAGG